jgi:F0F1-type ATP synthase assembly protein I
MPDDQPSAGRRVPFGLMVVGSEMASFTIIGLLLDFALGTMPGFTIGLTLAGLAVAFFHLVRMSKALASKPVKKPESPNLPKPPNEGTP